MTGLNNKVAVMFAPSGAIAGAVAKAFAQHGAKVYVTAKYLNSANMPGSCKQPCGRC